MESIEPYGENIGDLLFLEFDGERLKFYSATKNIRLLRAVFDEARESITIVDLSDMGDYFNVETASFND